MSDLPKVPCQLIGRDGNAFAILGRFQAAARKAGWPADAIQAVLNEAMDGDYNHLLITIDQHCIDPSQESNDGEEEDDR